MKYKCEETGTIVSANNYTEAANKMFANVEYENPSKSGLPLDTVYTDRSNGYARVRVFKVGDKQGTIWGVQAAIPKLYTLKRMA